MAKRHGKGVPVEISMPASFSGTYQLEYGTKSTIINSTWLLNNLQTNAGSLQIRYGGFLYYPVNLQFTVLSFDAN
jgi:hypothetical protein